MNMIRQSVAPSTIAPRTYSFFRSAITVERMTRAYTGHPASPRTRMIEGIVGRDTPRIVIARMIIGIESCASVSRIRIVSIRLPK